VRDGDPESAQRSARRMLAADARLILGAARTATIRRSQALTRGPAFLALPLGSAPFPRRRRSFGA
jgi:hypothetical protein